MNIIKILVCALPIIFTFFSCNSKEKNYEEFDLNLDVFNEYKRLENQNYLNETEKLFEQKIDLKESNYDFIDCSLSYFQNAFKIDAGLSNTKIIRPSYFIGTIFQQDAIFKDVEFNTVSFKSANFCGNVDFRNFSAKDINLDFSEFWGQVKVGLTSGLLNRDTIITEIDFENAYFHFDRNEARKYINNNKVLNIQDSAHAEILLCGITNLKLPYNKFKLLKFSPELQDSDKRNIIAYLKTHSYNNENQIRERFELDYILERELAEKKLSNELSYRLLGYGYKPKKIFLPTLIFIFIIALIHLSIIFFIKRGYSVFRYLSLYENQGKEPLKKFFILMYFWVIIFWNVKFDREIFKHCNKFLLFVVVAVWVLGKAAYVFTILLSKEGALNFAFQSIFGVFYR